MHSWISMNTVDKKTGQSLKYSDLCFFWSGRRESNPPHQLGRLRFYR